MGLMVQVQEGSEELPEQDTAQIQQFLTFFLQDELFGLNILPIKEIIEYGNITSVPMVPEYVRGVINLRGNVVAVIDLPVRFGWQPSAINKRSCIVIVEVRNSEDRLDIGIVIDRVSEVVEIDPGCIGPSPSFGAKIRTDFISGMGEINGELVVLLNPDKVLSIDELSQLDKVAAG